MHITYNMILILQIYLALTAVHAVISVFVIMGIDLDGVEDFYDWVAYNVLWPLRLVKAILKCIANIWYN